MQLALFLFWIIFYCAIAQHIESSLWLGVAFLNQCGNHKCQLQRQKVQVNQEGKLKSCCLWCCFINMMLIPRSQSPLLWLSVSLFAVHLKSWSAQCLYSPAQRSYLLYRLEQLRQIENKRAQSHQVHPEIFGGHAKQIHTKHLFPIPVFRENKMLILFSNLFCLCFYE